MEERAAADGRAARDQQLGEDRDGVGLGVRRDPGDDLAEQLVVDDRGGGRGPARRRRQRSGVGRPGIVWLVEQRRCHSAEISATAIRAEDSSTIAFLAANAAISEATARLLISRGKPRETSWIRPIASSENRVSERPASAR